MRRRDPRGRDRRRPGGGSHPHRCRRAGGRTRPGSVQLIAVSKKMPADDVRAAWPPASALRRKLRTRAARQARRNGRRSHPARMAFHRPLQSNKVKYVAGQVALVHTVDSLALLEAIEARAVPQPCLVQVNVAGETAKRGVAPEALAALLDRFATAGTFAARAHVDPTLSGAGGRLSPALRRAPRPSRRERPRAAERGARALSMGHRATLRGGHRRRRHAGPGRTAIFGPRARTND